MEKEAKQKRIREFSAITRAERKKRTQDEAVMLSQSLYNYFESEIE